MNQNYGWYQNVVEFSVQNGKGLEDAIREAKVPIHFIEQIRLYFQGPVEITPPDMLVEQQVIELCDPSLESQPYTAALEAYLREQRGRDRSTIANLKEASEDLVSRLPKPTLNASFRARGLVVGYVQSGKTASMAALITRAADQGYKLFIVLAGTTSDLRAQTQKRLDQEITGHSDCEGDGPFVQLEPGAQPWVRLTLSGLEGEFRPGTHNDMHPQTPKLAVIKKHVKVLEKFITWLKQKFPVPLEQLPALVIDDEADQASINTNYSRTDEAGDDLDPTKTNALIRELLQVLPKCAYVGFTATPFANVLIDSGVEDDLFPRDFIATLPEPHGYFGSRQLFGLGMAPSKLSGEEVELPPLDVIRHISQKQLEKIDQLVMNSECPEALEEALWSFLLSSCARWARGQEKEHFTMLIHPSQRTDDHAMFARVVSQEIEFIKEVVARPRSFPDVLARVKKLWEEDFVRVTESVTDPSLGVQGFDAIWGFARSIAEQIELKVLNSYAGDSLDYSGEPKRYVVVGGNKLSRGLTLEGLGVSFFTRGTNYYDTLLQMGRWFGYRPGYHDLTRIFVEKNMAGQFADLARVELEMRNDLRKYAHQPNPPTPAQLAPKIRLHPSMAVTSRVKMGAGRLVQISFQSTTQNTVNFSLKPEDLRHNIDVARALVASLGPPDLRASEEGMHIWKEQPVASVLGFISSYKFGPGAQVVNRYLLSRYIQQQVAQDELLRWDIVVPKGSSQLDPFFWATGVLARKVRRRLSSGGSLVEGSIGVLQDPGDIKAWKGLAGRNSQNTGLGCIMLYVIDKESGKVRDLDSPAKEDIVGLVMVFPGSSQEATVETYISQHLQ